ncbi:MAG: O-antigen ligase family protein [bacterium]|nr:O-antigen ligase family protein [bacterium]
MTNLVFKAEQAMFYLLVFLVPFQVRKFLVMWVHPKAGVFNEWTTAFLYGTDLLIVALFILWAIRSGDKWKEFSWKKINYAERFLLIFLAVSAISLCVADNKGLGVYRLIKLAEFITLYFYLTRSVGKVFNLPSTLKVMMASAWLQAIWAIAQAFLQRSLGLHWLGESVLRTNFYGVTVVPFEGGRFLRAYGATPHPNVLAAWLFMGIFCFYFWYLYPKKARSFWPVLAVYVPLLWGFFFTFSRVVIGLWVLGLVVRLVWSFIYRKRFNLGPVFIKRVITLFMVSVMATLSFAYVYWPVVQARLYISSEDQALTQRIAYNKIAEEVTGDNPWLGVGVGQLVWDMLENLPAYAVYFYQPVHNIYLLVSSETGLIGLAAFGAFIFCLIYRYILVTKLQNLGQLSFLVVIFSVFAMGLFDHFLWTLQQGQLIFWLILAFADISFLSAPKKNIID